MGSTELTEGAIVSICEKGETEIKPVLQVADLRLVNTQNSMSTTERYRLLLSDGVHLQQGMLATQHNALVKTGVLQKGSLLRLLQFVCNKIQQRMIIIMVEVEVLQEACPIIGDPKLYSTNTKPNGQESRSVGQAEVPSGNAQNGNPRANVPGPTHYPGEVGRLPQQPKTESSPQIQSYCSSSTNNPNAGRYDANNRPLEYSASVSGNGGSGTGTYGGFNNSKTDITRPPSSSYSRPQQPMYQQQQQPHLYTNRGPVAKNEAPHRIVPIAALNPFQGRWTIKARVTAKSDLRHYNNARGEGRVFSFDLLDSDGGEIKGICFNAVVDQFYDVIEVGKVYTISKGTLKPAQKQFNHLPNEYEMILDATSLVQPCYDDDDSSIPGMQFHFHPVSEIEGMDNNSILDVIGVVTSISPTATIMRKNGTEVQKRSLQLRDMSGKSVELTMWGNFCNAEGQKLQNLCDSGNFPVLALKAARISEFNGKALGTISSTQLYIEPDCPEARELKVWFDREGKNLTYVSISRETMSLGRTDVRKTISQIKDEKLGTSEKPDWITVCATLSFMKMDSFCYTACPLQIGDRQCNKKVMNNGDGKWRCDRCDQTVDECDYRYVLQFQIQDHTGLTWVTAFQECGEQLLGVSAKELFDLKYDKQDEDQFQETIRAALFQKYIFKLKVKEETFSDEQRVKSTLVKAERVNFTAESNFLSDMMHKVKSGDLGVQPKTENITTNIGHVGMTPSSTGFNSNKSQYANQYSGGPNMSGTHAACASCGGSGHSSTNCPSIISQRQPAGGVINQPLSGPNSRSITTQCFKCQKFGHFARDCPGLSSVPPAYGGNNVNPGRYGGAQRQHIGGF